MPRGYDYPITWRCLSALPVFAQMQTEEITLIARNYKLATEPLVCTPRFD